MRAARVDAPKIELSTFSDRLIRAMAAILAISGSIYLVSVIWIIFIPGGLIWIGWVAIALGTKQLNKTWFWSFSAAWNFAWLLYFGFVFWFDFPNMWWVVAHLFVATGCSIIAVYRLHVSTSFQEKHAVNVQ